MPCNESEILDARTGWCVNREVWPEIMHPDFSDYPHHDQLLPPPTSKKEGPSSQRGQSKSSTKSSTRSGSGRHPALEDAPMRMEGANWEQPKTWEEGKRQGYSDEELDSLVRAGVTKPPDPWTMSVANRSTGDKLYAALRITEVYLPQEFRTQFRQLFSAQNAAMTGAVLAAWGAGHAFGYSYVVNLVLLAVGAIMTGRQVLDAAADLYDFLALAASAKSVADLHKAAKHMSSFITTIGIEAGMALFMKGARSGRSPASRSVPVIDQRLHATRLGQDARRLATSQTGIAPSAMIVFRNTAQKFGVNIFVRPPRAGHARLRDLGHPPKPEWAKMKTVGDLDRLIGGPTKDGVAFFKPKKPPESLRTTDPQRYQQAMDQYRKRMAEWDDPNLQKEVAQRAASGEIRVENGLIVDQRSGLKMVSDYDLFEITDQRTGRRLDPSDPVHREVIKVLTDSQATAIQHGAHMNWQILSMKQAAVKYRIAWNHLYSESLVQFNPDGTVWRSFYEPRLMQSLSNSLGAPIGRGDDLFE